MVHALRPPECRLHAPRGHEGLVNEDGKEVRVCGVDSIAPEAPLLAVPGSAHEVVVVEDDLDEIVIVQREVEGLADDEFEQPRGRLAGGFALPGVQGLLGRVREVAPRCGWQELQHNHTW